MKYLVPVILAILTLIVTNEYRDWAPRLTRWLVRKAARFDPDPERMEQEWLAEFASLDGLASGLLTAAHLWIAFACGALARRLPRARILGLAVVVVGAAALYLAFKVGINASSAGVSREPPPLSPPFTAPEINSIDLPVWLAPLAPLARLPLWGHAAVLSAGVAGLFFVLPIVFRWVWSLSDETMEEGPNSSGRSFQVIDQTNIGS